MEKANLQYLVDWNDDGLFDHAYSDVSSLVLTSAWSHGCLNGPPGHAMVGNISVVLDNSDSLFSPENTSSPIYGLILPGLRFKIRHTVGATTIDVMNGFLQRIDPVVGLPKTISTANLSAYGILSKFAKGSLHVALTEDSTAGTLMGLLLDAHGWPSGDRDIDTGQSTLSKWWLRKTQPLEGIHDLEDEELGRVREGKDGKFIFEDRAHVFTSPRSSTVQATYGTGILNIWNP